MAIVIKIVGILIVLVGILYLLKPKMMNHLLVFFKKGKRVYFMGLVRFVLAIVFLLGARQCDGKRVIAAFGILFLISGLLIFLLGAEKVGAILDWFSKQSVLLKRISAVFTLAVGAAIIYFA